tara:strand:- start:1211 stop:1507 length:297 start_codon:yes stop_codon:yes gene_type:complete
VGVAMPPPHRRNVMAKQKMDKRTSDYKDNQLGLVIRISTSYLVEVTEEDLEIIKEYSLDNFILNDLRTKRKLVEEGKSTMRKTTESVWNAEEKKQFGD